uniref:Capsid protein n=1 Tax=Grapevine-associated narna-like virus 11 TaxID=2814325 RepID=A0A8F5MKM5_9VIRU|nr:MAG: RNA-dependent RNA polymerase [Grapevine-associated narna-like virus 11]
MVMYSPFLFRWIPYLNMQNSVLGGLVNELTKPMSSNGGNGNRPRRRKNKSSGGKSGRSPANGGSRESRARNPGARQNPGGRDTSLSLTRSQFTATSPLNLFSYRSASTPGGIRVCGRELIGSSSAPAALTGTFAVLNPNPFNFCPLSFPRLSAFNPIYEHYKFHKCKILFQANTPTTTAGAVGVCIDYDAKDAAPASMAGVMRNICSTMANIYSDCSLEVLGSLSRLSKYETQEANTPDVNQLYQGILYVTVEGVTAASGAVLGYLIAEYDIEFYTPQ